MSDDDLSQVIASLPALSAPVKTGALKALSQLLGGATSYASAWIRRPIQALEDNTDAKTAVTRALTKAAAELAASDKELVERALQSWLPTQLRRQENKERVVQLAIDELQSSAINDNTKGEHKSEVDPDWLNSFERFAEDASSEKVQRLWAKVLSGEILHPGFFSRQTLRFIHELDKHTADCFGTFSALAVGQRIIGENNDPNELTALVHLESLGVVTGVGGLYLAQSTGDEFGEFVFRGNDFCLVGTTDPRREVTVPACSITKVGLELLSIVPNPDEFSAIRRSAHFLQEYKGLRNNKILGLAIGRYTDPEKERAVHVAQIFGDMPRSLHGQAT